MREPNSQKGNRKEILFLRLLIGLASGPYQVQTKKKSTGGSILFGILGGIFLAIGIFLMITIIFCIVGAILAIIGGIFLILGAALKAQETTVSGQPQYQQYPPPSQPQYQQYPPPPQQTSQQPPGPPCASCGTSLTYVQQYGRWYCPNCRRYL